MMHSAYYPVNGRVVLHIDMNAFYCSVHAAEQPEMYRGRPCAVAGSVELRRGIVVTSSYEARARGVRTGMHVRQALKCCPELILIRPDFALYRSYSSRFLRIAREYSPLVQVTSIDECYVDITGSKQFGTPMEIAEEIQRRIRNELSLPCSIGIAPNKLLAKTASDMKKPGGITVLRLRDVPRLLWDKPCSHLFGIGRRTADKLAGLGIHTLGQLAQADALYLEQHFGVLGPVLIQHANGRDDSPVNPDHAPNKSIGHTTTLPHDYTETADIHRVFLNLADQVGRRLRRQRMLAETVQITIRNPKMRTITRAKTLDVPTEDMQVIFKAACDLFAQHWKPGQPVRLLGISLHNLCAKEEAAVQLDLFDYQHKPRKEKLIQAMDAIRDKFGENALLTAGMLTDDPSSLLRDHRRRGTSLQSDHLLHQDEHDEAKR